jgi:hypothetical protein
MRYLTALLGAAAIFASEVIAFPAAAIEYAARAKRDPDAMATIQRASEKLQSKPRAVGFNAAQQYVSNQGQYAFVAPDLTRDARGPCPGLNAMANHGYIVSVTVSQLIHSTNMIQPHNGVATIQQFIDGTYEGK